MNSHSSLPLPLAGHKFTVKKNAGPIHTNLYHSLHAATLHGSSVLHPVKEYIDTITAAFDDPMVKRKIRAGGLDASMQKVVWKKIKKAAPEVAESSKVMVKDRIKRIIKHFGKTAGGAENSEPGISPAKITRYRSSLPEEYDMSAPRGGLGGIQQAPGINSISAQAAAKHAGALVSANQSSTQHLIGVGNFSKKNSLPPSKPTTPSRPRPIIPLAR
ncbi:MAG: hypothetical protein Q7S66_00180 [bacterium]|nr:hypothetical protein [bacterium]